MFAICLYVRADPPSRLFRRLHSVLPDRLAVALHTGLIRIWRSIQDGDLAVSPAPQLEIVLLVLGAVWGTRCSNRARRRVVPS